MKPLKIVKLFISLIALVYVGACGRSFKTLDDKTIKALETPPQNTPNNGNSTTEADEPQKEQIAATSELWVNDIPNKYDDVGSFFRVREVPGLQQEQTLDSVQIGDPNSKKTLNLIRGKLKLSRVIHHYDPVTNQLEVSGDVTFSGQNAMPFKMTGPMKNGEISLKILDQTSALRDVFRAKAMCSSGVNVDGIENSEASAEFCRRLIIDFYYRNNDTFYTDQLITKEILFDEFKKNELPAATAGDPLLEDDLEGEISDYEKSQRYSSLEAPSGQIGEGELPYYFAEPSIDDVATLYPDVSKDIEARKETFFKGKKKIKAVPKLTGDERIPEKDTDAHIGNIPHTPMPINPPGMPPAGPVTTTPVAPSTPQTPSAPARPVAPTPAPSNPQGTAPGRPVTPTPNPSTPQTPVAPGKPGTPVPANPPPVTTPARPVTPTPAPPNPAPVKPTPPKPTPTPPARPESPKPQPPVRPTVQAPVGDPNRPRDQAIGKAMNGHLVNSNSLLEAAQKLGTAAGFEILWPTKKRHYGTYDMVDLIVNLGEWLLENVKGVPLSLGDVSAQNGGPLGRYVNSNGRRVWVGHASHRTGMDIDIAYLTRDRNKVMNRVDLPDKGGYTHSAFLAAEQWQLMKMTHEVAPVEVIFVNRNIKNEMCKQALKAGDLKSNTDTTSLAASILTKMVVQDKAHGDHWHVRLDCQMLKTMKFQTKCLPHPQLYVGPECKNIKL